MNRALKTGTNLCDAKMYTMINMRQISKVSAMNSFCLQLNEESAFHLMNKAFKRQPSIHRGRLPQPTPPPPPPLPETSCSIDCIYHPVNVL